jgi:hypothetical protein
MPHQLQHITDLAEILFAPRNSYSTGSSTVMMRFWIELMLLNIA